jgi:hypothetical protein
LPDPVNQRPHIARVLAEVNKQLGKPQPAERRTELEMLAKDLGERADDIDRPIRDLLLVGLGFRKSRLLKALERGPA